METEEKKHADTYGEEIMTKQLPCKDCITLAICKATALRYDKGHEGVKAIYDKCSILRDYLDEYHKSKTKTTRVEVTNLRVVYDFFLPHIMMHKLLYQQSNISVLVTKEKEHDSM